MGLFDWLKGKATPEAQVPADVTLTVPAMH
jgi:hypothetical protein